MHTIDYKYNIGDIIKDDKRNITIIDRKYFKRVKNGGGLKKYKYLCNICGYECGDSYKDGKYQSVYWVDETHLLNGTGCTCCQGRTVVKGINDIETTHKEIIRYFKHKEDAYKYTCSSHKNIMMVCPICKEEKLTKIKSLLDYGYRCQNCSDNMSIGEKIIYNLLTYLNINFIKEYSKRNCEWCNNLRYDFFIADKNIIIEVMGKQHIEGSFRYLGGRTLDEEIENDIAKEKLAINNGVERYIKIDAYKSDFDYIKNSILNSELNEIYNLNNIDWVYIEEQSTLSIIKKICDYWNCNTDVTTTLLSDIFHFSTTTLTKYLKQGDKLGWCIYNKAEWNKRRKNIYVNDTVNTASPIKCIENNTYYKSLGLCIRLSEEIFNIKLNESTVRNVIKGKFKKHRGYTFCNISKEEFNNASIQGLSCYGSPFIL